MARVNERFYSLVGDQRDLYPAGVLQARREEVHLRLSPVVIRDEDFAEVVLRKLSGQPLEPHQRRDHARPQRLRERIQRRLPARIACHPGAMQELDRPQRRVLGQRLHEDVAIGCGFRWTSDLASGALRSVIDRRDRRFGADASHRPQGHALSVATSCHVWPARRSTWISCRFSISIILSLVGTRISDDFLAR